MQLCFYIVFIAAKVWIFVNMVMIYLLMRQKSLRD